MVLNKKVIPAGQPAGIDQEVIMLDQINDPKHPRNFTHWHRIPDQLKWLCIPVAGFSAAFGGMEVNTTGTEDQPRIDNYYDLMFFTLHEIDGKWFIKPL